MKSNSTDGVFDWASLAKSVVFFSGVFFLCAYISGRLYLSNYFGAFGVSVKALQLSPEQIMFTSFKSAMMIAVVSWIIVLAITSEGKLDLKPFRGLAHAVWATTLLVITVIPTYWVSTGRHIEFGSYVADAPLLLLVMCLPLVLYGFQKVQWAQDWVLMVASFLLLFFVTVMPRIAAWGDNYALRHSEHFDKAELRLDKDLGPPFHGEGAGVYVSERLVLLTVGPPFVVAWHRPSDKVLILPTDSILAISYPR